MLTFLTLCGLIYVSLGAFSFPTLDVGFRYSIPIDTCIPNVTASGNTYESGNDGSMICRCNEVKNSPTESSVMCHFYENGDCTGELAEEKIWGGCDTDNQYLYTVENCSWAQEVAASGNCPYWVTDSTTSSDLNQIVTPLYQCMDYNCIFDNDDADSRSCYYTCNNDDVGERYYSDYNCLDNQQNNNKGSYSERNCGDFGGPGCGVKITRYDLSSGNYECGSKNSPFKTKRGNGNVKYLMKANQNVPIPIGECFEVRNGFYSYSYEYECDYDKSSGISTVMKKVYLGSGKCKGSDYHIAQNYSSLNYTISCRGSNGKGSYGVYGSCDEYNWDAYYADTPMLFGECVPFMLDPDTEDSAGYIADEPWNQDLRVVFSCNVKKNYLSAYFYVDEDCKGDYLFFWDWDYDSWNMFSYGDRRCGRPKIQNCGNKADKAGKKIAEQLYEYD